jgi:phosphomannomutase
VLVKGADTSRIVDRVVASEGGSVVCVPTGELHLVRGVVAHRAGVAGEGNGGVIVPEVGLARDGVAAAAVILELVATTRRPLSQLVAELPATARRRSAIPCADDATALAALQRLAARVGAPPVADPTLGVAVERRGGAWALIRMSATERVLRLTAEGPTPAVADELHEEMRALAASP